MASCCHCITRSLVLFLVTDDNEEEGKLFLFVSAAGAIAHHASWIAQLPRDKHIRLFALIKVASTAPPWAVVSSVRVGFHMNEEGEQGPLALFVGEPATSVTVSRGIWSTPPRSLSLSKRFLVCFGACILSVFHWPRTHKNRDLMFNPLVRSTSGPITLQSCTLHVMDHHPSRSCRSDCPFFFFWPVCPVCFLSQTMHSGRIQSISLRLLRTTFFPLPPHLAELHWKKGKTLPPVFFYDFLFFSVYVFVLRPSSLIFQLIFQLLQHKLHLMAVSH